MGLLGGIFKVTGKVAGLAVEYGIKATGATVALVAELNDNDELARKSRSLSAEIGEHAGMFTNIIGYGLGVGIDKAIEVGGKVGGAVGEFVVECNGGDDSQKRTGKIIGSAVGGGAIGLVTGEIIGTAVSTMTAATGIASTGTAISTLHGAAATNATIAAIGGGALAAGGGGIAAGEAILTGIDVVSATVASIDAGRTELSNNKNDMLLDNPANIIDSNYTVE